MVGGGWGGCAGVGVVGVSGGCVGVVCGCGAYVYLVGGGCWVVCSFDVLDWVVCTSM